MPERIIIFVGFVLHTENFPKFERARDCLPQACPGAVTGGAKYLTER